MTEALIGKATPLDPADDEVYNTDAAAAFIRRSPYTLEAWRSRGQGPPYIKAEGSVVYLKSDLLDWLKGKRITPSPSPS